MLATKTLARILRSLVLIPALATSAAAQAVDTFEDLGPDGTAVMVRVIDGVTVSLSTSTMSFEARTYGSATDVSFTGAGNSPNNPSTPSELSGSRFIGTTDVFATAAPIVFLMSEPIAAFGLTSIDLLETSAGNNPLTLQAFDGMGQVVAEHVRTGDQDGSGLSLLWRVASDAADIVEVRMTGNVNSSGYGIDDLFVRTTPITPFQIEISQESTPGAGDFDANILGTIDSSDYFLTPQQYYSWHIGGSSFTGPGLTSSAGSSLSVFRSASTGERCLIVIHDQSEDGSGGSADVNIEILGDSNGAEFLVEDDITGQFADTFTVSPNGLMLDMDNSWDPCCTDGAAIGTLEGDWSVLVEFTAVPSGILTWVALSRGTVPQPLTLEVGRRVRLRSLEGTPPVGVGDCFADGTGASCPCGNSTTPGAGCATSTGSGAVITGTGSPSVAADDLQLFASGVIPGEPGLIFSGIGSVEVAFGDGLRCVGAGQVYRYPIQFATAAGTMSQGPGLAAWSLTHFPVVGHIVPGSSFRFQAWFRDPQGPCASSFNLSNAVSVTFGP
jgi:hypothetical protein